MMNLTPTRIVDPTNFTWRNRRRMAWSAFISIIVVTGLCFFYVDLDRLSKLTDVVTWFYMTMASIVGAYMGLSTYASVKGEQPSVMYQDQQSGELLAPIDPGRSEPLPDDTVIGEPVKKRGRPVKVKMRMLD